MILATIGVGWGILVGCVVFAWIWWLTSDQKRIRRQAETGPINQRGERLRASAEAGAEHRRAAAQLYPDGRRDVQAVPGQHVTGTSR